MGNIIELPPLYPYKEGDVIIIKNIEYLVVAVDNLNTILMTTAPVIQYEQDSEHFDPIMQKIVDSFIDNELKNEFTEITSTGIMSFCCIKIIVPTKDIIANL